MKKACIGLVVTLGLLAIYSSVASAFRLQADKENVVASRLEGKWQPEAALTLRLTGREITPASARRQTTFRSEETIAHKIPDKYKEFLGEKRIYMSGIMTRGGREYPFILIAYKGNPYIVYFRERDGDRMGDAESFNLMLAVAKDKEKDLLFIGGDFNKQPFSAYERTYKD